MGNCLACYAEQNPPKNVEEDICVKTLFLTPSLASWTKQEISILEELGHVVHFLYLFEHGRSKRPSSNLTKVIAAFYGNVRLFLKGLLRGSKCDLIYCWFVYPTGVLAVALGKILRKPVLLNAVGYDVAYLPIINYGAPLRWYCRPFVAWALRNATKVIAISKESACLAEKWGASSVGVIYEGIDVEKFKPLRGEESKRENGFCLLTVASLEKMEVLRRDLRSLLKALREVVKKISNVKLVVVGEKADGYPILKRMVSDLEIESNVVFTDFIPASDLLKFYRQCDIFVFPSLHDGFPTVCAEAQACEKPVISTNASSMPEVIVNGETGILVKPQDYEALAGAIEKLFSDSRLSEQLGKSGRKRVVHLFSREVRKKKLERFIMHELGFSF